MSGSKWHSTLKSKSEFSMYQSLLKLPCTQKSEGTTAGSAETKRRLASFASWLFVGGNPPRAAAMIGNRPLLTSVSKKSRVTPQHKLVFQSTETHPIYIVLKSVGTTAGSAEARRQLA
ncbi:hypothetical protein CSV79_15140 [Sporosarcina sp. P13]|nr:hypothetical protein CSV79_15140 [Sporosarcina sp. P13]